MPVVEVEPNHSLVEAWPNSAPAFYNICDHFVMLLHSLYITFVKINYVSAGPTSRKFFFLFFYFSFFHSVSNFLGASLVKDLASGSG